MHKTLLLATYWTLLAAGTLHFIADVLSQYFRGLRKPSYETTLYYGLHSAYSLGQVVFAIVALLLTRSGSTFMDSTAGTAISFAAVLGWLAIALLYRVHAAEGVHRVGTGVAGGGDGGAVRFKQDRSILDPNGH